MTLVRSAPARKRLASAAAVTVVVMVVFSLPRGRFFSRRRYEVVVITIVVHMEGV